MPVPGETLKTGAAPICKHCGADVQATLGVMVSAAGYYIGTRCDCGPYTRESRYYFNKPEADAAFGSGNYGR